MTHKIYSMPVKEVWPHYVRKAEKKYSLDELYTVTRWLTGLENGEIDELVEGGATFEEFFAAAPMNPDAELITGVMCGVRVEEIEEPLMKKIRQWDKVVDELGRGKKVESILRSG